MTLIDEQYIFSIKVSGCSQQITKLSISQSQSEYDYICNVCLASQDHGRGEFRMSILNKDMYVLFSQKRAKLWNDILRRIYLMCIKISKKQSLL